VQRRESNSGSGGGRGVGGARGFGAGRSVGAGRGGPGGKPELKLATTTLWEYPSQHYGEGMQGSSKYIGATPSWVIWQCLQRYTKPGDTVLDPMCGSGTTLDVCTDLGRKGIGFDLAPTRADIRQGDARKIVQPSGSVDFVFVDPPYSTHIEYSDHPDCIGKLTTGGDDGGAAYYEAMQGVIGQCHRVMRDGGYMGVYVSDSWKKSRGGDPGAGTFMPIGFELFAMMCQLMKPVDIICVVRHNAKLEKANWHDAAVEGNYFLRGFNYMLLTRKEGARRK